MKRSSSQRNVISYPLSRAAEEPPSFRTIQSTLLEMKLPSHEWSSRNISFCRMSGSKIKPPRLLYPTVIHTQRVEVSFFNQSRFWKIFFRHRIGSEMVLLGREASSFFKSVLILQVEQQLPTSKPSRAWRILGSFIVHLECALSNSSINNLKNTSPISWSKYPTGALADGWIGPPNAESVVNMHCSSPHATPTRIRTTIVSRMWRHYSLSHSRCVTISTVGHGMRGSDASMNTVRVREFNTYYMRVTLHHARGIHRVVYQRAANIASIWLSLWGHVTFGLHFFN